MTDTITVVGNVATVPEQRTTGTGSSVTSFRLASSERRPGPDGTWIDGHTNYYTVSVFRTLGEHAFTSLRRGERVIVTGRVRIKEWDAAGGGKGRSVDIDADALGHDLRFGTSVFQRGARSGASDAGADTTDAPPGAEGGWSTRAVGDSWAAPGAADDAAGGSESDAGRSPLVLAAQETPF